MGRLRLLPQGIAGRITLVLIAGLILTLIASLATASLDRLLGSQQLRYPQLLGRIATVAAIVDWTTPEGRGELLARLSLPQMAVRWAPDAAPPASLAPDWFSRHLRDDLRHAMGETAPAEVVVDRDGERYLAWLRLDDGSWLELAVASDLVAWGWPSSLGLGLVVLTGGITLLAVWAARRVTEPLGRFAEASQRLGTDVGAPPMDERGPSEIRQAARTFNQMQRRIRRLVDDRTRMLAAIAHDLRTALTRLRLRIELIEEDEQRAKAAADLDAMAAMLDETLAFARDGDGGEAQVELDLAALVQVLCDDLSDAGRPVAYHGPPRLAFRGRPVALRRALANLVDNALIYGGQADVTLDGDDAAIHLTVADRGPGIAEALREQVFQPFFRLEPSRSRDTGGTGLGLAVARTIVHRHGGEILLDDRAGGGLSVRVILPRPQGG